MNSRKIVVAIVKNEAGEILLSERLAGVHLAGFWEFPGGKVEESESFKLALRRELYEEVGIQLESCCKLVEFDYRYDDRLLHFQAYIVHYDGDVVPKEGQKTKWVDQFELDKVDLPPANQCILSALLLPNAYMIADYSVLGDEIVNIVKNQLQNGISLIQFRASSLDKNKYITIAKELASLCREYSTKLIINSDIVWNEEIKADGVHLNSHRLKHLFNHQEKSNSFDLFSASCHDEREVEYANALNVKTILIGSVQKSKSHPDSEPLGWARFSQLCLKANMPVFAIGGLRVGDIAQAKVQGAQGIAGIREFIPR
ncbi:MAG: Nudix family hydrolase [Pseudomonadota bacterium]